MKRRDVLKAGLAVAALGGTGGAAGAAPKPGEAPDRTENGRWSVAAAKAWHAKYPWIMGYNYVPSTAVNQLEFWQAETFDPETIDRELGMAEAIGLNALRFWTHDIAWKIDPKGFKERMNRFLDLCGKHHTWAVPTLFTNGGTGPARKIEPGPKQVGWLQGPGLAVLNDPSRWGYVEDYVADILTTFRSDDRILFWSLFNEPENQRFGEKSLPFLRALWSWARKVNPVQPLSSPAWTLPKSPNCKFPVTCFLGEHCDVMSFHCYRSLPWFREMVDVFLEFDRPVFCTEYLERPNDNNFFDMAPLMKEKNVGAFHFGLVNGKCKFHFVRQKISRKIPEPEVWTHDIYRKDGTPYDPKEIELIKKLTGKSGS